MNDPRYRLRQVVAALSCVAFLGVASEALATVDISGAWTVQATSTAGFAGQTASCLLDFGVSGSTLSVTGSCTLVGAVTLTGTASPTGTFTAGGTATGGFCSSVSIAGSSSDGKMFGGTFSCIVPEFNNLLVTGMLAGSRCGNGVLDPGEQCDTLLTPTCCVNCAFAPPNQACLGGIPCHKTSFCTGAGTTCPTPVALPDGTLCTDVQCHADACQAGTCVPQLAPSGTPCDDHNPCTVKDTCDGTGTCVGGPPRNCEDPCSVCAPFIGCEGPGDIGFVPPAPAARCEDGVSQSVTTLIQAISRCHIMLALAAFQSRSFDEEGCETTAKSAYDAATGALSGCPACLQSNLGGIRDTVERELDDQMADLFCAGTVPLGENDSAASALAVVPPDRSALRCGTTALKNVAKYTKCAIGCHIKRADGQLTATTLEACEYQCQSRLRGSSHCPDCFRQTPYIADIDRHLDCLNGDIYCASPSGAFLN